MPGIYTRTADGLVPAIGAAGEDGADGVGVPAGGAAGQVLAKNSATDYDTEWVDQTGGGGEIALEGAVSDLTDVDLSTPPENGQVLIWNGDTLKWEPGTIEGGGGDPSGGGTPGTWGTIVYPDTIDSQVTGTLSRTLIDVNISPDFQRALYLQTVLGQTRNMVWNFVASQSGPVHLWWRRETESEYDKLWVKIDGVTWINGVSGIVANEYQRSPVISAGAHTLEVSIYEDGSTRHGISGCHIYAFGIP